MRGAGYILGLLALSLCFGSCEKEETISGDPLPPVSETPEIWLDAMPTSYAQFDDVTLEVNYRDGDGDIGFANADSAVVFVTDNRDDILLTFHIGPQAPEGESIAIEGQLDVVVENVILLDQDNPSETTTYSVQIRDRWGNWSNTVTTPQITISQ